MVTPIGPTPAPAPATPATPARAPAVTPATPATPGPLPLTVVVHGNVAVTIAPTGAVFTPATPAAVPGTPVAAPTPAPAAATPVPTPATPAVAPTPAAATPVAPVTPAATPPAAAPTSGGTPAVAPPAATATGTVRTTPAGAPSAPDAIGTFEASTMETYIYFRRRLLAVIGVVLAVSGVVYWECSRNKANEAETSNFIAAASRQLDRDERVEALKPTISVKVRAQRIGDTAVVSLKNSELKVDDCKETHPATISVVETEMAGNGVIKATVNIVITAHGNQEYTYEGTVMAGRVAEDVLVNADLQ